MTLIEIMVVVAILVILVTIVVWTSGNISDSAKIDQTKQIMETLTSAIEVYRDVNTDWAPRPGEPDLDTAPGGGAWNPDEPWDPANNPWLRYYAATTAPDPQPPAPPNSEGVFQIAFPNNATGDDLYVVESIEGLVYYLRHEPAAKAILDKVPEDAIKTKMAQGGTETQLIRERFQPYPMETSHVIVDPWGTALRYHRHPNINNGVPYFRSYGPDELPSTDDDIYSYDR